MADRDPIESTPTLPAGVTLAAWQAIGAEPDGDGWRIPERNADGEVVGWSRRFANGGKGFVTGGHRGLTYAAPFPSYAGSSASDPVCIVEGASDTAAGHGAGLCVVGRPNAPGGGDALAALLKGLHVLFVAENDGEGDKPGPGTLGAERLADRLARVCASVRIIHPPAKVKDLRAWIIDGGNRDDVLAEAGKAQCVVPKPDRMRFDSVRPLEKGATESNISIVPLSDLAPATEPDWVWPGYVARGAVTLFTGLWKSGKSTLVGYLLRDVYRGGGLVEAPTTAPTLIFSEEPEGIWTRRRDDLGLHGQSILFARRETFAKPNTATWLQMIDRARQAIEDDGVGLVVFDTLPSLWPVVEENDAGEVIAALAPIRDLTNAGAAVLLLCHPRKGEGGQGTATRGSGALPGFVDVILEMRRDSPDDPTDRKRVLRAYGRYEATPPEQVIELGTDGYRIIGDRREARAKDLAEAVGAMLPNEGEGVTAEDLRDGWPEGSAKPGLTQLRGVLNRGATDGRWLRSGTGHKGDPWRFRASDSIPSPISLGVKSNRIPEGVPNW
jgi:hypothetical protein